MLWKQKKERQIPVGGEAGSQKEAAFKLTLESWVQCFTRSREGARGERGVEAYAEQWWELSFSMTGTLEHGTVTQRQENGKGSEPGKSDFIP